MKWNIYFLFAKVWSKFFTWKKGARDICHGTDEKKKRKVLFLVSFFFSMETLLRWCIWAEAILQTCKQRRRKNIYFPFLPLWLKRKRENCCSLGIQMLEKVLYCSKFDTLRIKNSAILCKTFQHEQKVIYLSPPFPHPSQHTLHCQISFFWSSSSHQSLIEKLPLPFPLFHNQYFCVSNLAATETFAQFHKQEGSLARDLTFSQIHIISPKRILSKLKNALPRKIKSKIGKIIWQISPSCIPDAPFFLFLSPFDRRRRRQPKNPRDGEGAAFAPWAVTERTGKFTQYFVLKT